MPDDINDLPEKELEDAADPLRQNVQEENELSAQQPSPEQEMDEAASTLHQSFQTAEDLKTEQESPARDMGSAASTLQQNFEAAEELKQQHDTASEIGHDLQAHGVQVSQEEELSMPDGFEETAPAVELDNEITMPEYDASAPDVVEEPPPADPEPDM